MQPCECSGYKQASDLPHSMYKGFGDALPSVTQQVAKLGLDTALMLQTHLQTSWAGC